MTKKFFWWTIIILGFAILFWIFSLVVESRSAIKWPKARGQMISSLLFIKHLPKFVDSSADPTRWYGADVQYEYSVGDNTYVSNRLSFAVWGTRNPKDALREMNKYRHLNEVTVYYDPANPQSSVLEPTDIGDITIPLMIGALLAFWGIVFLYDESLVIKTRGRENYLHLGNAYEREGKFEEALNEYNKLIEIGPYLAQGYKSRGNLYLQHDKWDEAITDFNQAISIDPYDSLVHFNRAKAYLGKEQYEKAWTGVQKAMELGFTIKSEILEEIKTGLIINHQDIPPGDIGNPQ